jgi:hypothetical protein
MNKKELENWLGEIDKKLKKKISLVSFAGSWEWF